MPKVTDVAVSRGRSLLIAAQTVGKGSWPARTICSARGHSWKEINLLVREHMGLGVPPPDAFPTDQYLRVRRCQRCGTLDRDQVAQLVAELDPSLTLEAHDWATA